MKQDLQNQARTLRQQGMSINDIVDRLGVAKSSISTWVRDVELTEEQKQILHSRRQKFGELNAGAQATIDRSRTKRLIWQAEGRAKARDARPLHLSGCML